MINFESRKQDLKIARSCNMIKWMADIEEKYLLLCEKNGEATILSFKDFCNEVGDQDIDKIDYKYKSLIDLGYIVSDNIELNSHITVMKEIRQKEFEKSQREMERINEKVEKIYDATKRDGDRELYLGKSLHLGLGL